LHNNPKRWFPIDEELLFANPMDDDVDRQFTTQNKSQLTQAFMRVSCFLRFGWGRGRERERALQVKETNARSRVMQIEDKLITEENYIVWPT
jgi:hypothetical protein